MLNIAVPEPNGRIAGEEEEEEEEMGGAIRNTARDVIRTQEKSAINTKGGSLLTAPGKRNQRYRDWRSYL